MDSKNHKILNSQLNGKSLHGQWAIGHDPCPSVQVFRKFEAAGAGISGYEL